MQLIKVDEEKVSDLGNKTLQPNKKIESNSTVAEERNDYSHTILCLSCHRFLCGVFDFRVSSDPYLCSSDAVRGADLRHAVGKRHGDGEGDRHLAVFGQVPGKSSGKSALLHPVFSCVRVHIRCGKVAIRIFHVSLSALNQVEIRSQMAFPFVYGCSIAVHFF